MLLAVPDDGGARLVACLRDGGVADAPGSRYDELADRQPGDGGSWWWRPVLSVSVVAVVVEHRAVERYRAIDVRDLRTGDWCSPSTSSGIEPRSLRLDGRTLTWREDGEELRQRLFPGRPGCRRTLAS